MVLLVANKIGRLDGFSRQLDHFLWTRLKIKGKCSKIITRIVVAEVRLELVPIK